MPSRRPPSTARTPRTPAPTSTSGRVQLAIQQHNRPRAIDWRQHGTRPGHRLKTSCNKQRSHYSAAAAEQEWPSCCRGPPPPAATVRPQDQAWSITINARIRAPGPAGEVSRPRLAATLDSHYSASVTRKYLLCMNSRSQQHSSLIVIVIKWFMVPVAIYNPFLLVNIFYVKHNMCSSSVLLATSLNLVELFARIP